MGRQTGLPAFLHLRFALCVLKTIAQTSTTFGIVYLICLILYMPSIDLGFDLEVCKQRMPLEIFTLLKKFLMYAVYQYLLLGAVAGVVCIFQP